MTPSLPIPTDNIYKFACIFGLALIIVSVFSFVATYNSSFERKVKYIEIVIPLENKEHRTKAEEDQLIFSKKIINISTENERVAMYAAGTFLAVGIILSFFGGSKWYEKIQQRDDKLAELQIAKLSAEIEKIKMETSQLATERERSIPTSEPPDLAYLAGDGEST